jgi:hypothetical protein
MDPILRFNWIFYAIFGNNFQHSTVLSFVVALSEIFRRGMWTALRVENEHCTNVGRLLASRDVPLPYKLSASPSNEPLQHADEEEARHAVSPLVPVPSRTSATGQDASRSRARTDASESSTIRRRRLQSSPLLRRMGSILHMAHAQDFERRKRSVDDDKEDDGSESSDDDADNAEEEEVEESIARADAMEQEELAEEPEEPGEEGEDGSERRRGDEMNTAERVERSPASTNLLGRSPDGKTMDVPSGTVRRKPKEGGEED